MTHLGLNEPCGDKGWVIVFALPWILNLRQVSSFCMGCSESVLAVKHAELTQVLLLSYWPLEFSSESCLVETFSCFQMDMEALKRLWLFNPGKCTAEHLFGECDCDPWSTLNAFSKESGFHQRLHLFTRRAICFYYSVAMAGVRLLLLTLMAISI